MVLLFMLTIISTIFSLIGFQLVTTINAFHIVTLAQISTTFGIPFVLWWNHDNQSTLYFHPK
jgi:hypothetical protein